MPITVRLPNGQTAQFPDGMPQDQIQAAIASMDPMAIAPRSGNVEQTWDAAAGRPVGGLTKLAGQALDFMAPDRAAPVVLPMDEEDYQNVGSPTAWGANLKNAVNRGAELGVGLMGSAGRALEKLGGSSIYAAGAEPVGRALQAPERAVRDERAELEQQRAAQGRPSLMGMDLGEGVSGLAAMSSNLNRSAGGVEAAGQQVIDTHTSEETEANIRESGRAFDRGFTDWAAFALKHPGAAADVVVPSLVEYAIPGGAAGRGVRASLMEGAALSGERAAARVAAEGGDALAQAAARTDALILGTKAARDAAGMRAAQVQALQSGSSQAAQAGAEVMAMAPEQLAQFPGFTELEGEVGFDRAREIASRMAEDATLAGGTTINLLTYAGAQRLGLNPFETRIAGGQTVAGAAGAATGLSGRAARAGVHGAQEAAGEFVQGAGEQLGQNLGMGAADSRVDPGKDVLKAGAMEAAVGGVVGGLSGATTGARPADPIAPGSPIDSAAPKPDASTPAGAGAAVADGLMREAGVGVGPRIKAVPTPTAAVDEEADSELDALTAPYAPEQILEGQDNAAAAAAAMGAATAAPATEQAAPVELEAQAPTADPGATPADAAPEQAGPSFGYTAPRADYEMPNFGHQPWPVTVPDTDPIWAQIPKGETINIATPERQQLRERIIKEHFRGVAPAAAQEGRKPIAYVMGGGGASGKGTLLAQLQARGVVPTQNIVELDPDRVKTGDAQHGITGLPEYAALVQRGDSRAAHVVHEESSAISAKVRQLATAGGYDMVIDRTLGDPKKARAELEALKRAGYEVRLFGITLDPEQAVERAYSRATKRGRFVPTEAMLKAHRGFAEGFESYIPYVDAAELYDNSGTVPTLLARKAADGTLEIDTEEGYARFANRRNLNEKAATYRELAESVGTAPRASAERAGAPAVQPERVDEGAGAEQREARPAGEASTVAEAAAQAATSPENDLPEPTDAQKEAGNYAKGKLRIDGLDFRIENPAGTKRRPEWPTLKYAYGYITGTEGNDGDHVDVFLHDDAIDTSKPVYVIDQNDQRGRFDEHKVMIGFDTEAAARAGYLSNYTKGWTGLGAITEMSWDQFKDWVRDPANTVKRAAGGAADPVAAHVAKILAEQGIEGTKVQIVDEIGDLSTELRSTLDGETDGVYDPKSGQVFLIRGALPTDRRAALERATWVVWHELAGHFGLRHAFPGKALAEELERAGTNPTVRALADAIRGERGEISPQLATEEALAELAAAMRTGDYAEIESRYGVEIPTDRTGIAATISRVIKILKQAIVRAFGGTIPYSDTQVRQLLEDALTAARTPAPDMPLPNSRMLDAPVGARVQGPSVPGVPDAENVFEIREVPIDRLVLPEVDSAGEVVETKREDARRYADRMRSGEQFPNARGYELPDGRVKIADGHRRAVAARDAGRNTLRVAVLPITRGETPVQSRREDLAPRVADEEAQELLQEYGEPVLSDIDASRRLMNGDRVFGFHEMAEGEDPLEIFRTDDLRAFAPDQLLVLSRFAGEAPMQSRRAPDDTSAFFARTVTGFLRDMGHAGAINDDGTITIYHGTSAANARGIERDGAFRGFPFFTPDRAVAKRYAQQVGTGPKTVMELRVDPGALVPTGGYLSARMEGLRLEDGVWSLPNAVPLQSRRVPRETQSEPLPDHIDGNITISQVDADIQGERGSFVSIYGWGSRVRGVTRSALRALKDYAAPGVVVAHDVGPNGSESRSYWEKMRAEGLVDEIREDDQILQSRRRTPADAMIERGQKLAGLRAQGFPVTNFTQTGSTWNQTQRTRRQQALQQIRRVLQDRMIGVRSAQRDIEAAIGGPINELANVYRAENLMHGKAADRVRRVREGLVEPLKKLVKDSGIPIAEVEQFLWAQHAIERNKRIAKINPGMQDAGSGMTTADAQAIVSAAQASPNAAKLKAISDAVQALRMETLHTLRNSGQITPDQFVKLRGMYRHYVPLRGHEGVEGEARVGSGRGVDMRGKPVQRALGRKGRPANILGELVGDLERAQVQAAKAEVGRTLLRAALEYPNPDFWQVERVTTEQRFSEASGEVYTAVVNDVTDEETIIVKHRGQPYRVRLVDPDLRKAMFNLGVEGFEGVAKWLGWINRWLSAVFTRFNPAFVPVNMLRDMIQGGIGVSSELGGRALGQVAALYPRAAAGLYAEAKGAGDASVPDAQKTMADWAREFLESGAATGYQTFADAGQLQQQIELEMAGLLDIVKQGKPLAAVSEAVRRSKTMQTIETANEIIENSMRLAVYVQRRKAGTGRAAAAEYAKNLTVNFNRKGAGSAIGNALFLFFNASMQGSHRTLRLMRDPRVLAGLASAGALQFALAVTLGGARFEDDDETLWEQIPDHVRQKALVIPLGFDDKGGPEYVAIPMPFGFNLFTYAGGYPALLTSPTWRSRHNPVRKTMGDIARAGVDAFSVVPVGEDGWYFPTVVRIFSNLQANKDDLGRRIRDEGVFEKFERPRSSQGRADTPQLYKDIATALNRIGGGDDYTKPVTNLLDFAPEDIEYLLGTFTGGPGTMIQQAWRSGERAGAGLPMRFDDIPIARRIVGSQGKAQVDSSVYYDSAEVLERGLERLRDRYSAEGEAGFYALRDELGPQFAGVDLARYKSTDREGGYVRGQVRASADGTPTLAAIEGSVYASYKSASKAVKGYGTEIRRTFNDPGIDRLERRRTIDQLQLDRADAMREFIDAWNATLPAD